VVNKVNYELQRVTNDWEAFTFCYENQKKYTDTFLCMKRVGLERCSRCSTYEGWNFNSGNYLFTTDTK